MRVPAILLAACFALSGAMSTSAYAQMPPQQAEARSFKLGIFEITALHDAQFVRPNDGKTFGVGHTPEEIAEVLKGAGAPTDTVTLSVDALVVKTRRRLVLIDTGVGGALQQSLAKAGYKPSEFTDVLITHSHPDHVGGLVKDGKLVFPKAEIRMSGAEWAYAKKTAAIAEIVKVITPKVRTFHPGASVLPGIESVPLPGHTPGHVGYEIFSGSHRMLDIGDTAHSSILSLAKPDWPIAFDGDADRGEKNRIDTLNKLARTHELIFAPHFPFPGVGYIKADGDHFKWDPSIPQAR